MREKSLIKEVNASWLVVNYSNISQVDTNMNKSKHVLVHKQFYIIIANKRLAIYLRINVAVVTLVWVSFNYLRETSAYSELLWNILCWRCLHCIFNSKLILCKLRIPLDVIRFIFRLQISFRMSAIYGNTYLGLIDSKISIEFSGFSAPSPLLCCILISSITSTYKVSDHCSVISNNTVFLLCYKLK